MGVASVTSYTLNGYGAYTIAEQAGQGKLIPTQSNAFPTQIMRWKDVERSKANYKQVNLTNNCKALRGFERLKVLEKQVKGARA